MTKSRRFLQHRCNLSSFCLLRSYLFSGNNILDSGERPMKDSKSDRAATRCEIGIADGIFGGQLSVEATEEGLEFGDGYSSLSWDWILAAREKILLRISESQIEYSEGRNVDREVPVPSSHPFPPQPTHPEK